MVSYSQLKSKEIVKYISICADVAGLQQADGSFFGDQWGEVDTRLALGQTSLGCKQFRQDSSDK